MQVHRRHQQAKKWAMASLSDEKKANAGDRVENVIGPAEILSEQPLNGRKQISHWRIAGNPQRVIRSVHTVLLRPLGVIWRVIIVRVWVLARQHKIGRLC